MRVRAQARNDADVVPPKDALPQTGLTFLGYCPRRPWLWLVDLDSKEIAPANTSLPGADSAISEMSVRDEWLAVQTHSTLWSVPLALNGPGRRVVETFTFAPSVDGRSVWVEAPGELRVRHRPIAVDGHGVVVNRLDLPLGWRLHAETPAGFVIEDYDHGQLATFVADEVRPLVDDRVRMLGATHGSVVVWTRWDDNAVLGMTDAAAGRTQMIRHPAVAEWQSFASFSPDGRTLAIGGFPDPREPLTGSFIDNLSKPYVGRPALMMLVDTASGACRRVQGEYDQFATTPAWSADGGWVAFHAPFQSRRLYVFRPDDGVLHTIRFRRSPPTPMLDVTGRIKLANSP
ncbi:MAG: hypothetical protein M3137_16880 [Actinomycetota bacterium]|nr:hypothetical protein [Actinomycetota bacterium]